MNENYNPFNVNENNDNTHYNEERNEVHSVPVETKVVKPLVERLKGIAIIAIFYATQILGSFLFGVILVASGKADLIKSTEDISGALKYIFAGSFAAEAILITILLIFYRKQIASKLKETFRDRKFFTKLIGYFALLWITTSIFGMLDMTLFPQYANDAGDNQQLIEKALENPSIWMLLSICVSAPLIEEYVFRYGFIKKLLYGMNKYVAAVVAALIFSFAHIGVSQVTDLPYFLHLMFGYMGQALVFGFVYVREDNLVYPMLVHFINNAQAVVLIILLGA